MISAICLCPLFLNVYKIHFLSVFERPYFLRVKMRVDGPSLLGRGRETKIERLLLGPLRSGEDVIKGSIILEIMYIPSTIIAAD